jgi:hypothetical protein
VKKACRFILLNTLLSSIRINLEGLQQQDSSSRTAATAAAAAESGHDRVLGW